MRRNGRYAVSKFNLGQANAILERTAADLRDTIRNRNSGQAAAALESTAADLCNAIRNYNIIQVTAALKSTTANPCNLILKLYSLYARTVRECIVSNGSNTRTNIDILNIWRNFLKFLTNLTIPVLFCFVLLHKKIKYKF